MQIDYELTPQKLLSRVQALFEASARKIHSLENTWNPEAGAPVYTVGGRYTSRGWTEWTQGFQFGSAILQFDATREESFLEIGRDRTVSIMAPHITNTGVHDHGFNNVSTYGNLLRLMNEGRIPQNPFERNFYELALRCSGAVQAARWTKVQGGGFVHSFNGPHSLFVDTIRSLRALALSHQLGHVLVGENDKPVSLLGRLVQHAEATARFSVFYGEGRDFYDVRGRTTHEAIFNVTDGNYRCPNSQQGYSPFSTWTRGLAWAMCGFAEQLEWLRTVPDTALDEWGGRAATEALWTKAAEATCDFYLAETPTDGIPFWDTGAPGLARMDGWRDRPSDPFNTFEPVDSSAAAIAAQGLLRLGRYLSNDQYFQAGLTVCNSLFAPPYLDPSEKHQGLILHSVYHRPNGWDFIPDGGSVPRGEATMWGDYHAREVALYVQRLATGKNYLTFFN